jgi:hypothetical protein
MAENIGVGSREQIFQAEHFEIRGMVMILLYVVPSFYVCTVAEQESAELQQ